MTQYRTITKALIVLPAGEAIFSELATTVSIDDEAAGPFVVVSQDARDGEQKISLCHEEWPAIREAIERQLAMCLEIGVAQAQAQEER
jgi:hypothetical protein